MSRDNISTDLKIVFENEACVAVDKPANWLAVPGRDPKDTRPILGRELEKKIDAKIYPIHRLDAEVTGLIIFAKQPDFHREANKVFENRQITKIYQAFTERGPFEKNQKVRWTSKLLRGKKRAYEANFGKPSTTEGYVHDEPGKYLEWRLNPLTGRSHQLRYELFKHDCPILGDKLYGSTQEWPDGIALRSLELNWPAEFAEQWKIPQKMSVTGANAPV